MSWRHPVPSQISGIVTTAPCWSVPATVSISPFGSVVLVGYQRPQAMSGSTCHERVAASNRFVFGSPESPRICPPATSSRPSARKL